MNVRDLISGETVSIEPTDALREAVQRMTFAGVGALVVQVDGTLQGIVSERDIVRACAEMADLDTTPVGVWMTPYPDTCDVDMPVNEAAAWILAAGYRHLPVVDGSILAGVLSIKDILWAVTEPTLV